MPINLREDVAYIILKKIKDTGEEGKQEIGFNKTDFTGRELTESDFLGHLDYLNQNQYIKADFSGNAYANQPNSPLTDTITFQKAELTEKGQKLLQKMEQNPPKDLDKGLSIAIATKDMPFLEKVMLKGGLNDIFDARDMTEIVFRVMRDLMTTEAADRVAEELHEPVEPTKDKTLQMEIVELWKDTNPIVGFLSRIRPPWQGPGIFKIDSDRFLFRVANEGGMPADADREQVVKAVFSATKDELSEERIQEIAQWLPDKILQLWQEA